MPTAVIAAGVGLAGSVYASSKAAKSAKSAADQQMALAQPSLAAGQTALPKLTEWLSGAEKDLGKGSDILTKAGEMGLNTIDQAATTATKRSKARWTQVGDVGQARGETFRIAEDASKAKSKSILDSALAQEDYKDRKSARYLDVLGGMMGQGNTGLSMASSAISERNAATQDLYGDIAGAGGKLFGYGLDSWESAKKKKTAA